MTPFLDIVTTAVFVWTVGRYRQNNDKQPYYHTHAFYVHKDKVEGLDLTALSMFLLV